MDRVLEAVADRPALCPIRCLARDEAADSLAEPVRGFTLVEVLVAMALIIFIMVILTEAFTAGTGVFRNLKSQGDMQEKLRAVAGVLRNDIRQNPTKSTFFGNADPPNFDVATAQVTVSLAPPGPGPGSPIPKILYPFRYFFDPVAQTYSGTLTLMNVGGGGQRAMSSWASTGRSHGARGPPYFRKAPAIQWYSPLPVRFSTCSPQ